MEEGQYLDFVSTGSIGQHDSLEKHGTQLWRAKGSPNLKTAECGLDHNHGFTQSSIEHGQAPHLQKRDAKKGFDLRRRTGRLLFYTL
jgi:hypothetical protein